MPTKYRDYAGLFPNYQALGNARAQSYQNNANSVSQLLQALSQIAQANATKTEADNFFSGGVTDAPTMRPNFGQRGATPIGENFDGQVSVQPRIATPNPVMQQPSITPRSQDPRTLIAGLMSQNPEIARRAQAGIQGIQLQAPKNATIADGSIVRDENPMSPTFNRTTENKKDQTAKISTGFSEFLSANAKKYEALPDGLELAYKDYQQQGMDQFKKKEETKAGLRAKRDGKQIGSYNSEDGFKTIIWRNADGGITEIKSNDKVKESAQSATLQKEENKLSNLSDLSNTIRSTAKPEYLGGFVSGMSGNGMGGVTGGIREATGFIDDSEVMFRANVESLKNQLLYARSGAQINENEYQRLLKEVPSLDQPANVFNSRLDAFDKQLKDILSRKKPEAKPARKTIKVGGATITVED